MNKNRLKEIAKVVGDIREAFAAFSEAASACRGSMHDLKAQIEQIRADEEESKENLPENMQSGDKADRMDTAISALEEAEGLFDEIEEAFETLDSKPEEIASGLEGIE